MTVSELHLLLEVCSSNSWARNVLAGGPFRDVDALLDRGRVDNAGSAREQAAVATAGDAVRAELAAKNRAYETSSAMCTWCAPAVVSPRSCWPP